MTTGIFISNGSEAIVVTDQEGSQTGRRNDHYTKVSSVTADSYHAVLYGAGYADYVLGCMRQLKSSHDTMEAKVEHLEILPGHD